MKKLTTSQIRNLFLEYFEEHGHSIEPSAPLVPIDDASLLWINSGVATMKKYFDGRVVPTNPRIVNAQKSIRTNDIENVGKTARHHTFFEMLGNFSIGDYFKEGAIVHAWEFLTDEKWIGFDPELLSITIHPEDEEAYAIWRDKVGIQKIVSSVLKETSGTSEKVQVVRTQKSFTTVDLHTETTSQILNYIQAEKMTVI